jgi:hypothetical protein
MNPRELVRECEIVRGARQARLEIGEKSADRNLFGLLTLEHPVNTRTHKSARK